MPEEERPGCFGNYGYGTGLYGKLHCSQQCPFASACSFTMLQEVKSNRAFSQFYRANIELGISLWERRN